MGWSGGTFTRVHDWTTDEGSAIDIEADRMDAEDDNFASGINACIHKGGSNNPTANLPMNGYRHTGVGSATSLTDYASATDVINQHLVYYVDSGAANAYVITPSPAITGYSAGQKFAFLVDTGNTSTGASTINVNGLGAKTIVRPDGTGIVNRDLRAGSIYEVVFDGSQMQLVSPHEDRYRFVVSSLNETRTSTTTPTNSTYFISYVLGPATYYLIEGYLSFTHAATYGGFKMGWSFSNAPDTDFGGWSIVGAKEGGTPSADASDTNSVSDVLEVNPASDNCGIIIRGAFKSHATLTATLNMQWAQSTSSAAACTIRKGSWIGVRSISQ